MPFYALAPATVSFVNASTPAFTTFLWHFGDGGSSTDEDPIHTYAADGEYTVTLVATNTEGKTQVFQDTVVVGDDDSGYVAPEITSRNCPGVDAWNLWRRVRALNPVHNVPAGEQWYSHPATVDAWTTTKEP